MFVVKEIVSVELLSKLDQLIYREANDRNGGLGTLLRGDGMWCLAPKRQEQIVYEQKFSFALLEEPGRHAMRKDVAWSTGSTLEAARPWMNDLRMSERTCVHTHLLVGDEVKNLLEERRGMVRDLLYMWDRPCVATLS